MVTRAWIVGWSFLFAPASPVLADGSLPPQSRSTLVQRGVGGPIVGKPVLNPQNGHYYSEVTVPARITWDQAKLAAEALTFMGVNGHLATLTSASENAFVVTNLRIAVIDLYWLGASQADGSVEPAGGWAWVTGEPFVYTNWEQLRHEPNNIGASGENRMSLWRYDYDGPSNEAEFPLGVWNDEPDWYAGFGYVAEFPVPPPPPITGACCTGTACAITTQGACAAVWSGAASTCGGIGNPTTCCRANIDGQNGLTPTDIFAYLNLYFAGDLRADFDLNGTLAPTDIFAFLNTYFAGCPA